MTRPEHPIDATWEDAEPVHDASSYGRPSDRDLPVTGAIVVIASLIAVAYLALRWVGWMA